MSKSRKRTLKKWPISAPEAFRLQSLLLCRATIARIELFRDAKAGDRTADIDREASDVQITEMMLRVMAWSASLGYTVEPEVRPFVLAAADLRRAIDAEDEQVLQEVSQRFLVFRDLPRIGGGTIKAVAGLRWRPLPKLERVNWN